MDLNLLTVASTRAAIEQRSVTASALVEDFYKKIAAEDGQIHAYITLSKERAQAKAAEIDALADKGAPLPPLAGVPLAIKEVMVTREVRSTAGSKILGDYLPPYDCTAVARLEQAGAIVLGKTNCDEFAMGSSNENSAWGPVRNPRDKSRVPGGSSGGSAAVVAAAGCEVVEISLPHAKYAIPTYYIVATAEASSNLARFDGVRYAFRTKGAKNLSQMYRSTRDQGFGAEVKRRIMLGTYVLSAGYYDAYYLKAQKVRTLLTRDFEQAFEKVDAVVTPTTPTPAFKLGEKTDDPLAMYLNDIYTLNADLVVIHGYSVP